MKASLSGLSTVHSDWGTEIAPLSAGALAFVFTSQLLHFNYFNHLVHSSVSSLFHLKCIVPPALGIGFSGFSYSHLCKHSSNTWLSHQTLRVMTEVSTTICIWIFHLFQPSQNSVAKCLFDITPGAPLLCIVFEDCHHH